MEVPDALGLKMPSLSCPIIEERAGTDANIFGVPHKNTAK